MTARIEQLSAALSQCLSGKIRSQQEDVGELTIEVAAADLHDVCLQLRDHETLAFDQLIDLCGVDYSAYGEVEWETDSATSDGFSRGVEPVTNGRLKFGDDIPEHNTDRPRYGVVYHLLSVKLNHRLRLRVYTEDEAMPMVDSVMDVWRVADWFEREAFDLYGIHFEGHPDLRRILTDYGFVGHPFRKDFPLSGNVEMRYDLEQKRVIYQPVSIEPRVLVPRVIRHDNRYLNPEEDEA